MTDPNAPRERWKHAKTGGEYEVLASGRLEADGESGRKYIVYRCIADGRTWIRPAREFMDGRFELLPQQDAARGEAMSAPDDLAAYLKLQAQCHAQEARTANATIAEIYRLCTNGTGEPGNWAWSGAGTCRPIRKGRRDNPTAG
jgi:hypothetical protein